ncbi:hypothetical protein [Ammoniphilus sp. CFH 90114]|uniref:hypothetical protein n=1 Tax=Ammoniphilus sp. CFH 90114 TaxID=2493665 RepID=UPI00100FB34C|nr:hypothetical protein [Ammoniphilus sp. CFH 90114]RXT14893.1 hypothetical protein EIZ39_01390 [Ammoniphilus sp. CFH 90114]
MLKKARAGIRTALEHEYGVLWAILVLILSILLIGLTITLFDDELADWLLSFISDSLDGVKKEWIGFWGSLLGAIIQGLITASGIFVTLQLFRKDRQHKEEDEKKRQKESDSKHFIENFGTKLVAYDNMLFVLSKYEELNEFYEEGGFDKLFKSSQEINDGEIFARMSLVKRAIAEYERTLQKGLFYYAEDSTYQDIDGKLRRNFGHLQSVLESKRKEHMERFTELTGIDVSEKLLWDKGRTFLGFATFSGRATVSATGEVIRKINDNNENE